MKTELTIIILLSLTFAGCSSNQTGSVEPKEFTGYVKNSSSESYNPGGCGFCFSSEDGQLNCELLGQGDYSSYLDKKVKIFLVAYDGPTSIMCPVKYSVVRIETIG